MTNRKAEQKILINGNKLIYREKCHNKRKYVKLHNGKYKYKKQNYRILTTDGIYTILYDVAGSVYMGELDTIKTKKYNSDFINEYKKHCKRKELKK